jgi:hypothetical protein
MEKTMNNKPIKVFSCGGIKAAIWLGSKVVNNEMVEAHYIKIDKSYKDKDDNEWKYTNTFNVEDLPKVSIVAMEAYKFVRLRISEASSGPVSE